MCYNSKTSLCVWAIIFFVIAAVLIALTIAFPFIVNGLAKDSVQLKSDNQDTWANIPGSHDLRVNRDYYLYDCDNVDQIYFAGAKPRCTEVGPVSFYENSTYINQQFQSLQVPGENGSKDAVKVNYQLNLLNYTDTFDIDKNISVVNQALFGLWYGAGNQASYSLATTGLYNVWQGFTGDAVTGATALAAQLANFLSQTTFNASVASTTFTEEQKVALFQDPIYGLSFGVPNFIANGRLHFSICPGIVSESDRVRIQGELKSYFGFTWQQWFEYQNYWCNADTGIGIVAYDQYTTNCNASKTDADFRTRCAFAQWSSSNVTLVAGQESVTELDQTVLGYPEMHYYQQQQVLNNTLGPINPDIYGNQFINVNFSDFQQYYHLLNYSSTQPDSLYYFSTMRTLMQTGESYNPASNVVEVQGKKMLDLSHFSDISQILKISTEHTFLLFSYLTELNNKSLLRSGEYPGTDHGAILGLANFVRQTLSELTNSLFNYLLPRGLYGVLATLTINAQQDSCEDLAATYFNNEQIRATICGPANESLGIDNLNGCLFWTMVFMDRSSTFNTTLAGVGISPAMLTNFYSQTGNFGTVLDTVMKSIKTQYSSYCATGKGPYCTDSELGMAQFAASAVTLNLPSALSSLGLENTNSVQGFAALLGQELSVPPEYGVFASRLGKNFAYDYTEALNNYQKGLNVKYVQDWYFTQDTENNPFDNSVWRDYLRYIVLEVAFNGIFVKHTPREIIHGYKDPLVTKIKNTPIYQGGDPTQNDILSIVDDSIQGTNIAFFTGADDYKYTKVYAEYNDSPTIKIKAPYRVGDGSTAQTVNVNPWREDVPLKGTDASLFSPLLEEEKPIWAFVSDIMIPLRFLYKGTITRYGLQAFRYELDTKMLLKGDEYEPNKAYYLDKYNGFANMTSLRGAKVFACQPHYFSADSDQKDMQSVILNATTGMEINPSHENDESYFFLEQTSGGQLEGYQKLQINILTETDPLFNMTSNKFDYFIPITYASRYTVLTEEQVSQLFGPLKVAKDLKTFLFCAGPVFAAVLIGLGVWFIIRRKNLQRGGEGEYKEVP